MKDWEREAYFLLLKQIIILAKSAHYAVSRGLTDKAKSKLEELQLLASGGQFQVLGYSRDDGDTNEI